ncbi:S8 family serine peptidase [Halobacteriovorax sp. HFRX-2_2]|uniref:S8 family serine peptidase n=1 Tax=unclassified Halobacteriovorax TaxID=2639665 RepID=UPI0037225101
MHQITQHILIWLIALPTFATSVVAISDNQIDINHVDLKGQLYTNQLEYSNGKDSDHNGKVDDLNGWNYIQNSGEVFDSSLIGTFDPRVFEYYEVRKKKTLKTATESELEWYKEIRKDDDFMDSRDDFSSYTHGSHVACLAMNTKALPYELKSNDIQFLPIRYLGDDPVGLFAKKDFVPSKYKKSYLKIRNIENYLTYYQDWMIAKMSETVKYSSKFSHIYHASWGQSWEPAYDMINGHFQDEFDLSEKEVNKKYEKLITQMRDDYMNGLMNKGLAVVKTYPKMLFVFSAGNKKDDTDTLLHYPSSIIADNVISVAAIDEHNKDKAYFSNFGKKTVTIFAPGVAINSCTPGDRYIPINGTSQAAPQVTNTAAMIFAMAQYYKKDIEASVVKDILEKSAKKLTTLSNLCTSGGTLDHERALGLARYYFK